MEIDFDPVEYLNNMNQQQQMIELDEILSGPPEIQQNITEFIYGPQTSIYPHTDVVLSSGIPRRIIILDEPPFFSDIEPYEIQEDLYSCGSKIITEISPSGRVLTVYNPPGQDLHMYQFDYDQDRRLYLHRHIDTLGQLETEYLPPELDGIPIMFDQINLNEI